VKSLQGLRPENPEEDASMTIMFNDFFQMHGGTDEEVVAVEFSAFKDMESNDDDSVIPVQFSAFQNIDESSDAEQGTVATVTIDAPEITKQDTDNENHRIAVEFQKSQNVTEESGDDDEDPSKSLIYNDVSQENVSEERKEGEQENENGVEKAYTRGQKKSKCAFDNYNENGKINTKAFNKSQESRSIWAGLFDFFVILFEEVTGFGPGLNTPKREKNDSLVR